MILRTQRSLQSGVVFRKAVDVAGIEAGSPPALGVVRTDRGRSLFGLDDTGVGLIIHELEVARQ